MRFALICAFTWPIVVLATSAAQSAKPDDWVVTLENNWKGIARNCFKGGAMVQQHIDGGTDRQPKIAAAILKMRQACFMEDEP
jgi:hypothetical protein